MALCGVPCRLAMTMTIGFVINSVLCETISGIKSDPDPNDNCYAIAVYNELMKAIEIIKAQTAKSDRPVGGHPSLKKFQEEENEGGILGDVEIPSIVPQFFSVVGQAFSFNRTAVAESVLEVIPAGLGNRLTAVLGDWANNILGTPVIPTTTRNPPKKRRRTTTTGAPQNSTTTAPPSTTPEPTTTEKASTTPEVLFKEGSLGELPVYASAYAPNYVATTTFPVYANSFLHILHAAPTTTTPAPTTVSTTTPSTTTDPNSYNVALPFDYLEITTYASNEVNPYIGESNGSAIGTTEYEDYEYDEVTGESTPSRSRADSEATSSTEPSTSQPSLNASASTTSATGKNASDIDLVDLVKFVNYDFMQYRVLKELLFIVNSLYKSY